MALPEKLKLEIVTPERKILSEIVDEVVLPGREGYLGVLVTHPEEHTSAAERALLDAGAIDVIKGAPG